MKENTNPTDRLTDKEEIVIRMLNMGKLSKDIPADILDKETKDRLLGLDMIGLNTPGNYILTKKAVGVLETGGFIVKYPMTTEDGVVLNFNRILTGYSTDALKALGLSVINTGAYKRWGRYNNVALYSIMKDTMAFYAKFDHVTTRLSSYLSKILEAQSDYEKILNVELSKISNFKLLKPITLGTKSSNGSPIILTEFISPKEGIVGGGSMGIPILFDDPEYTLTPYMKDDLIRQYHSYKSKQTSKG